MKQKPEKKLATIMMMAIKLMRYQTHNVNNEYQNSWN